MKVFHLIRYTNIIINILLVLEKANIMKIQNQNK